MNFLPTALGIWDNKGQPKGHFQMRVSMLLPVFGLHRSSCVACGGLMVHIDVHKYIMVLLFSRTQSLLTVENTF